MGLIKTESTLIEEAKLLKLNNVDVWLTIHDEIDYTCDRRVLRPLAKKMSLLLDISKYYRKAWHKFIRYTFDVEYDKWGSFTAGESVKIYNDPVNEVEHLASERYSECISELNGLPKVEVASEKELQNKIVLTIPDELDEEVLVAQLETIPEGETKVGITDSSDTVLWFYKKLNKEALLEVTEKLGIAVVES